MNIQPWTKPAGFSASNHGLTMATIIPVTGENWREKIRWLYPFWEGRYVHQLPIKKKKNVRGAYIMCIVVWLHYVSSHLLLIFSRFSSSISLSFFLPTDVGYHRMYVSTQNKNKPIRTPIEQKSLPIAPPVWLIFRLSVSAILHRTCLELSQINVPP